MMNDCTSITPNSELVRLIYQTSFSPDICGTRDERLTFCPRLSSPDQHRQAPMRHRLHRSPTRTATPSARLSPCSSSIAEPSPPPSRVTRYTQAAFRTSISSCTCTPTRRPTRRSCRPRARASPPSRTCTSSASTGSPAPSQRSPVGAHVSRIVDKPNTT